MNCGNPACASDALTFEMDSECKLIPQCLVCNWRGHAVDHDPETPTNPFAAQTTDEPARKHRHVQAQPVTPQPQAKPRKFNVLKEARARLRELNRDIARLEKLKRERDQLTRLLAAAKRDSGAVVPLRKAQ